MYFISINAFCRYIQYLQSVWNNLLYIFWVLKILLVIFYAALLRPPMEIKRRFFHFKTSYNSKILATKIITLKPGTKSLLLIKQHKWNRSQLNMTWYAIFYWLSFILFSLTKRWFPFRCMKLNENRTQFHFPKSYIC